MARLEKQVKLGTRWLKCGWRLFQRNPWLLLGMGCIAMLILFLLTRIPLIGTLAAALLLPLFMSSAFLTVDQLARQKVALPKSLRLAALRRSPMMLMLPLKSNEHTMTIVFIAFYAVGAALLINILAQVISGGAWAGDLRTLDPDLILKALGSWFVAFLLYLAVTLSLIYALPLTLLQNQALLPALAESLGAGGRYMVGLAVLIGCPVALLAAGALLSYVHILATFVVWLVGGAFVLPLFAASCYCSYRTLFPDSPTSA
ncbi:MAG: hypothetical protein ACE5K1_07590 [Acidiferrobacterales bacterium]